MSSRVRQVETAAEDVKGSAGNAGMKSAGTGIGVKGADESTGTKMAGRDRSVDILKGILVLQMVLCHCIQFFGRDSKPVQQQICDYINLTTFSGFMFTFGCSCWYAYFSRDFRTSAGRMLRTALKCLAAFWLSSICYVGLVELEYYDPGMIRRILLLEKYGGWSEFLASFAGVMVVGLILFRLFQMQNGYLTAGCLAIGALLTLIPYSKVTSTQAALFIGSTSCTTFPVLQYLFYFAAGVWFCRKKIVWDIRILAAVVVLTLPELIMYLVGGHLTNRFPPDMWFVAGAALFLYLYYLLAHVIADGMPNDLPGERGSGHRIINCIGGFLQDTGANAIFYLLFSNLVIFAFSASKYKLRTFAFALEFYVILMVSACFVRRLVRGGKKAGSGSRPPRRSHHQTENPSCRSDSPSFHGPAGAWDSPFCMISSC